MEWDTGGLLGNGQGGFSDDGVDYGSGLRGRFGVRGNEDGDRFVVFWYPWEGPEGELAVRDNLDAAREYGWWCWSHAVEALAMAGDVAMKTRFREIMGREVGVPTHLNCFVHGQEQNEDCETCMPTTPPRCSWDVATSEAARFTVRMEMDGTYTVYRRDYYTGTVRCITRFIEDFDSAAEIGNHHRNQELKGKCEVTK